jgi:hypothetical protein
MHKLTLLTAILLWFRFSNGQDLQLDIHTYKLPYYLNLEQRLGSQKAPNTSVYLLEKGVAQPVIYRRKEVNIPDLLCYYYYYEKDSALQSILYEWDESNPIDHREPAKKTKAEIQNFIKKYNSLYAQIAARYGKSKKKGDLSDISKADEGIDRRDLWNPDDSTEIEMYTALSNKYEQNGPVTTTPTYRIRLYLKNTKRALSTSLPSLTEEKIHALDLVAQEFFSAMKDKNMEKAKGCLSSLIVQKVTDTQFEQLSQAVRVKEGLEIFFTGVLNGLDGSTSFYVLQYKYANDANNPPREMVKVLFDDSDKIVSVQPSKRY